MSDPTPGPSPFRRGVTDTYGLCSSRLGTNLDVTDPVTPSAPLSGTGRGRGWGRRPELFLVSIFLFGGLAGCHRPAAAPDEGDKAPETEKVVAVKVATVKRGTIGSDVTASGVIAPIPGREAMVNAATAGKVVTLLAHQGDRVTKGQTLVQLDSTRLRDQMRQAQATVAAARAQVAQAALDVLSQDQSYRSAVQAAESALRTAELNQSKVQAGARPQEIAQSEAAVTQAEAALNNARATRDRVNTLLQHGIVAKKDAIDAETQYQTTASQLRSAREALSLVKAGVRPQEIADAQVQVKQARNALEAAKASKVNTQAKEEAMRSLREQVHGSEAALAATRADLSLATVRAPISGTVVSLTVQPGASVDTTTVLLTLANLSEVEFLAQLQPQSLSRVAPAQDATLTVAAYPGRSWAGTVTQVSQAADPKSNTVPARIRFANPGERLKDEMYGTVRIQAVRRSSLLVPSPAVLADDSGSYVFLVDGKGIAHRKTVKTGLAEGNQTEIISGVSTGERVITSGNYGLDDKTKVTVGP